MTKKLLFLLINFYLCTHSLYAKLQGQARIDSLKAVLQTAKADTHKIFLMSQISFSYNTINPAEGLKFGSQALELAREINWEKGIGNALYYRGANYLATSKFPEAIEDYLGAMRYFEKSGDSVKLAGALSNVGNVYGYQSKNEKALEYFLKALKINRIKNPGSNFEAANLANIGFIYFNQNEFEKALEYNLQALKLCEDGKFLQMLPIGYANAGGIYIELKDYERALDYSRKAISAAINMDDLSALAKGHSFIGIAVMQIVIEKNQSMIDRLYGGNRQRALADAKAKLDSAASIMNLIGDQNQLTDIYRNLSDLEEFNGNYKAALQYYKLFKTLSDTVFNTDKNEKILQSAMEYEFDKKEAAAKAQQEKKDFQQQIIRNSISAGLAGALIFLVVVYRQRNKIREEKQRSDELLLNILPGEVAEELKSKGSADAKQFDEVTVMFTDFKDFTQISERLSPAELVSEIDTCFKAFDHIIGKHNIEKIKTIGDSYMCAGGLPSFNNTHASDVLSAALEIQRFMLEHLQQRRNEGKDPFEIRIGIHTGPVVAGIVGVKKFAYDIWGDTVNIASRMESSGEAGKVNISGSTYELVKDKFTCIHRGKISAKNKGEIDMYFVKNRL